MKQTTTINRRAWLRGDGTLIDGYLHDGQSRVLVQFDGQWLFAKAHSPAFAWHELSAQQACLTTPMYLGEVDRQHYFCCELKQQADLFEPYPRCHLRGACALINELDRSLLFYAQGLLNWHRNHAFCSTCGSATRQQLAGHARACVNTDCAAVHYPKLDPAVIFSITHDDGVEPEILLARKKEWDAHHYSVIAGFVEPGETLEDAVRREAYEETGLLVEQVEYVASQPWPFPDALMMGFRCQTAQQEIKLIDQELETARWFSLANIRQMSESGEFKMPFKYSIAWQLLDQWMQQVDAQVKNEVKK